LTAWVCRRSAQAGSRERLSIVHLKSWRLQDEKDPKPSNQMSPVELHGVIVVVVEKDKL
jgi:hypothetical protein